MKKIFLAGIDTDAGKTVTAAVLTQLLGADYWKPIQSGDLHHTDTMKVKAMVQNSSSHFHQESYRLRTPASPHHSAALDGVEIDLATIKLPSTSNHMIVEGAGGLFVPLSKEKTLLDLMKELGLPTILVSKHYLGSINHTLLSIFTLQKMNIPLEGIIFVGEENPSTESIIQSMSQVPVLGRIPILQSLSPREIAAAGIALAQANPYWKSFL